jgi:hypothetical protein
MLENFSVDDAVDAKNMLHTLIESDAHTHFNRMEYYYSQLLSRLYVCAIRWSSNNAIWICTWTLGVEPTLQYMHVLSDGN